MLNVSSSVSDSFANISWISGGEHTEFYIAYMNNRKLISPFFSVSFWTLLEWFEVDSVGETSNNFGCVVSEMVLPVFTFIPSLDSIVVCSHDANPSWSFTLCTGEGLWKISEALNTSKTFHIIGGLEPGTEYTVRLIPNSRVDNSSIFEDVITTGSTGEEGNQNSSNWNKKKKERKKGWQN